jgi:hypothetical protein
MGGWEVVGRSPDEGVPPLPPAAATLHTAITHSSSNGGS